MTVVAGGSLELPGAASATSESERKGSAPEVPSGNGADQIEELLEAASELLRAGAHLDAVQVIHHTIARSLPAGHAIQLPSRYSTRLEAVAIHRRLLEARQPVPPSRFPLVELWRRRPPWAVRAGTVLLLVALTLRYALAVTNPANWARQHPEGNWIVRYYNNDRFEGFPLARYDIGVDDDFSATGPGSKAAKDHFSARWDTCLEVVQALDVALTLEADDRASFWVDGSARIQVAPGPGVSTASVQLGVGLHHLRVDFVEVDGMAMVRLRGLELEDTEAYRFRRPAFEGAEVACTSAGKPAD